MLYSFQQGLLNMPPKRDPDRRLLLLPTEEIRPNVHPSRKSFDRAALSELMVSIAQVGLIQPITVRELRDGYELREAAKLPIKGDFDEMRGVYIGGYFYAFGSEDYAVEKITD